MKPKSRRLLDKAARAIRAAETLLREGDADFAAGRAYYAMFYSAEALLFERGLQFRKHGAFGEPPDSVGPLLSSQLEERRRIAPTLGLRGDDDQPGNTRTRLKTR
jgi:hypothetical protein